jgi:hypothetical protein
VGKDSGRRAARALHPGAVGKGPAGFDSRFKFFFQKNLNLEFSFLKKN